MVTYIYIYPSIFPSEIPIFTPALLGESQLSFASERYEMQISSLSWMSSRARTTWDHTSDFIGG